MINKESLTGLMDIDWTKSPNILILILLFTISRVPLLNSGFGTDGDAWRIACSALNLNYFHIYNPSRFPGFPLPEFINSLVIGYGWLICNSLTMIISLVSVIVFAKILKELNVKNKGLLVITYMFFPILWIYSVTIMDYMWALSFIIISWYFILKNNYRFAGVMMGLAIGSRITSVLFLIPFVYLILTQNKKTKKILDFLILSVLIAAILLAPLYIQYGFNFFSYYPFDINLNLILYNMNYYFGILALLFAILICLISFKTLFKSLNSDKSTRFLLIIIILYLILFIKTPYEIAYLIPVIPFGLLLVNKITYRNFFVILCVFIMINSFISFNIFDRGEINNEGLMIQENEINNEYTNLIKNISFNSPENSVIITGEYAPFFYYFNHLNKDYMENMGRYWIFKKNLVYVDSLNLEEILELQKKGYKIYYAGSGTHNLIKQKYGFKMENYGCSDIFLHNASQGYS